MMHGNMAISMILWMVAKSCTTKFGWFFNPINNGMVTIYQLVQEFATIHSISDYQRIEFD